MGYYPAIKMNYTHTQHRAEQSQTHKNPSLVEFHVDKYKNGKN